MFLAPSNIGPRHTTRADLFLGTVGHGVLTAPGRAREYSRRSLAFPRRPEDGAPALAHLAPADYKRFHKSNDTCSGTL